MRGDFERYLSAKATVDDRALDRRVLGLVRDDICSRSEPRILEAGAGTAAFCRRVLAWDGLPDCTYVAVDTDPELLATARDELLDTARGVGFEASVVDPTVTDFGLSPTLDEQVTTVAAIRLRGPARIDVRLVAGDALTVAAASEWDVLVAQAFVDLLSPDEVAQLVSGVAEGGCVYFPITFDGDTAFVPTHSADGPVLDAYHATMVGDDGDRLGASAGRRLLTLLPERGIDLTAVGGSDWVVSPLGVGDREGYPADESYFLDVIVETVTDAVQGRVSDDTRETWLDTRQRERDANRLHFVARNLDLYGRRE